MPASVTPDARPWRRREESTGSAPQRPALEPEQLAKRPQAAGLQLGEQCPEDPAGGQRVPLGGVAGDHFDPDQLGDVLEGEIAPPRVQADGEEPRVQRLVAETRQPMRPPRAGEERKVEGSARLGGSVSSRPRVTPPSRGAGDGPPRS
jgi:hypothetical protein